MSQDAGGFLAALLLSDSALPIGRFAHSTGLEALLARDPSVDEAAIVELVESVVLDGAGPLDGVAVAHAHRAASRGDLAALLDLDRLVTARKLSPASRLASTSCGRRLAALVPLLTDGEPARTLSVRVEEGSADGNLAVVEGALAAALGIPCRAAVLVSLRGTAATLLSAAVRLGRLSAMSAQAALTRLQPALLGAAGEATSLPSGSMRAVVPELEIHALAHRRAATRLFST